MVSKLDVEYVDGAGLLEGVEMLLVLLLETTALELVDCVTGEYTLDELCAGLLVLPVEAILELLE